MTSQWHVAQWHHNDITMMSQWHHNDMWHNDITMMSQWHHNDMWYNDVTMTSQWHHNDMMAQCAPIVKVSAVLESRASELAGSSHFWWEEASSNERAAMLYTYITTQHSYSLFPRLIVTNLIPRPGYRRLPLQYRSVFQSFNLIGWVRVGLGLI